MNVELPQPKLRRGNKTGTQPNYTLIKKTGLVLKYFVGWEETNVETTKD
jgi:hypothetical protein